jgi:hypothetical protein
LTFGLIDLMAGLEMLRERAGGVSEAAQRVWRKQRKKKCEISLIT